MGEKTPKTNPDQFASLGNVFLTELSPSKSPPALALVTYPSSAFSCGFGTLRRGLRGLGSRETRSCIQRFTEGVGIVATVNSVRRALPTATTLLSLQMGSSLKEGPLLGPKYSTAPL